MRLLTRFDVQRALPMRDAIPVVKKAFAQLSTGRAKVPLRVQLPVEKHDSTTLVMSGYLSESDALAVKRDMGLQEVELYFAFPDAPDHGKWDFTVSLGE